MEYSIDYFVNDNVDLKTLLKESQDRQAALYCLEATVQFQSRQFKAALNKIDKLKHEITLANKKLAKRRSEVKEYQEIIQKYKAQCPMPLTKEQVESLYFSHGFFNAGGEQCGHMTIFLDTREDQENPKIHMEIEDRIGLAFDLTAIYEFQRVLQEATQHLVSIERAKKGTLTVRVDKTDLEKKMCLVNILPYQRQEVLTFLESKRV